MSETESISETTLRNLISMGAVRRVSVIGQGASWAIQIEVGTQRRTLRSTRAPVRWWKSMDRLTRWLRRDLGIAEWTVDARHYNPDQQSV